MAILMSLLSGVAAAQSESGGAAIQGTVLDPSAKPVSGANVKIVNSGTGYTRSSSSDATGRFQFLAMPVGSYSIEISAIGFAICKLQNVQVEVGQTMSLSLDLQLAGVQTEVNVMTAADINDTENAAISANINQRAVADLPIRGRNFAEFARLTPAIVQEPDRFGLVVSGQRSINSNVALDGADFNDALQGNQRGGNTPVFFFPQAAIREFQVVRRGATAEIGRTNAGFVNIQGRYDFSSLANYLALRINRYRQTIAGFNAEDLIFKGTQRELAFFVQDKIEMSSRVSLNAGLRWEGQWNPQPTRPNPAFSQTALIPNDLKQWQPRLGVTISPAKKSVIRLSGGIYTARTPGNLFQRVFTDNGITTAALDSRTDANVLNFLSFPKPLTTLPQGLRATAPRIFGFDRDFVNPRSFQGAVAFEQTIRSRRTDRKVEIRSQFDRMEVGARCTQLKW